MDVFEALKISLCKVMGDDKYLELKTDDVGLKLLINVRAFVKKMNGENYKSIFPKTFEFDEKVKCGEEKKKYHYDGWDYYFCNGGINAKVYQCDKIETIGEDQQIYFDKEKEYVATSCENHYKYYYINEIDHWITYLMTKCINGKGVGTINDPGLKIIKEECCGEILLEKYKESDQCVAPIS